MEIALLVLYLLGVVVFAVCTSYALKHSNTDEAVQFRLMAEMVPFIAFGVLTVLVVAWPATVAYNIYTQSRKK